MIELILSALALLNALLCVFGVPTWGTACAYWAILTALWFARAVRKGKDKRLGD